jgi:hypothetical protein
MHGSALRARGAVLAALGIASNAPAATDHVVLSECAVVPSGSIRNRHRQ